ncbi:MAG: glycosyltransferase family 39 protein [Dehalococcoidia bacterium]|nr:glycosyltransferase family 39 protein [Dehalococcoidia bacterium]
MSSQDRDLAHGAWVRRLILLLVAGGCIAAAFYAQSLFVFDLAALVRPGQIYLVAAVIFAFVFRLPPAGELAQPGRGGRRAIRGVVVLAAFVLLGVSWWHASAFPTSVLALFIWLASMILFVVGAANWPRRFSMAALWDGARQKATLAAIILPTLVVALALGVRLYRLGELPDFFIDESISGYYTLKSSLEGSLPLFTPVWEGASNVPFGLQGFVYSWFGQSLAALRLPYAFLGALEVFFVYLLGKEIGGKKAGLVAATLLALLEVHVHFSRTTMFASTSIAWTGAAVFLARGVRRGSWFEWALAGVIVGLGLNAGFPARLLPAMVILFVLGLFILHPRSIRWLLTGILFLVAGYVIGAGPFLANFVSHPDQYMPRSAESWLPLAIASFTNSASLAQPVNVGDLLWTGLYRETLGINLFGDAHTWYREGRPMLGALISPLFFLGLAALTLRLRDWRCLVWGIWLWASFLLLGVTSNVTPVFHRPVPFMAMACLAIGVSVSGVGSMVGDLFRQRPVRWAFWLAVGGVIGSFAVLQLSDYFLNYAPRDNWPTDDLLVRYLHDLGPANDVVMVADHDHEAERRLIQFGIELGKKNVAVDWKGSKIPANSTGSAHSLVFIVHPSRLQDLAAIKALYPGGTELELKALGKTWWTVYRYGVSH